MIFDAKNFFRGKVTIIFLVAKKKECDKNFFLTVRKKFLCQEKVLVVRFFFSILRTIFLSSQIVSLSVTTQFSSP